MKTVDEKPTATHSKEEDDDDGDDDGDDGDESDNEIYDESSDETEDHQDFFRVSDDKEKETILEIEESEQVMSRTTRKKTQSNQTTSSSSPSSQPPKACWSRSNTTTTHTKTKRKSPQEGKTGDDDDEEERTGKRRSGYGGGEVGTEVVEKSVEKVPERRGMMIGARSGKRRSGKEEEKGEKEKEEKKEEEGKEEKEEKEKEEKEKEEKEKEKEEKEKEEKEKKEKEKKEKEEKERKEREEREEKEKKEKEEKEKKEKEEKEKKEKEEKEKKEKEEKEKKEKEEKEEEEEEEEEKEKEQKQETQEDQEEENNDGEDDDDDDDDDEDDDDDDDEDDEDEDNNNNNDNNDNDDDDDNDDEVEDYNVSDSDSEDDDDDDDVDDPLFSLGATARGRVLQEFVITENKYVRDLRLCTRKFVGPILEGNLLGERGVKLIFCNMSEVADANEKLLKDLEREVVMCESDDICIGSVFESHLTELIPLYAVFCVNQSRTMSTLETHKEQNTPFFQFTEEMMKDPDLAGLSLLSYVIKPVQRLCKYPLLLRELLKNTEEGHPDREPILSAFEKTQMLVDEVNELQRRSDRTRLLLEIEKQTLVGGSLDVQLLNPERHLIKTGRFETGQQGWLFNDSLLLATIHRSIINRSLTYEFDKYIRFEKAKTEVKTMEDGTLCIDMFVKTGESLNPMEGEMSLVATVVASAEDGNEWVKTIQGSMATAKGYRCQCPNCASLADKSDGGVISYSNEEESAALCLRYVDLEERILGWDSPKIRTFIMQEGSFEIKKQEDTQPKHLFLFTDLLLVCDKASANFFSLKKSVSIKSLRLEESNPDVLCLVFLKKGDKMNRLTLYSSPKVVKRWKETLSEELEVKLFDAASFKAQSKKSLKKRISTGANQQRQIRSLKKEFSSVAKRDSQLSSSSEGGSSSPFPGIRLQSSPSADLSTISSPDIPRSSTSIGLVREEEREKEDPGQGSPKLSSSQPRSFPVPIKSSQSLSDLSPKKPLPTTPSKNLPSTPPEKSLPASPLTNSPNPSPSPLSSSPPTLEPIGDSPEQLKRQKKEEETKVSSPLSTSKGDEKGVIKCGFLTKQGGGFKNWKKRWCQLDETQISYYKGKDPTEANFCGKIELVAGVEVGDHSQKANTFEIRTSNRVYLLTADKEEEVKAWMGAVNSVLEKKV